jgi:hypothetical protein
MSDGFDELAPDDDYDEDFDDYDEPSFDEDEEEDSPPLADMVDDIATDMLKEAAVLEADIAVGRAPVRGNSAMVSALRQYAEKLNEALRAAEE